MSNITIQHITPRHFYEAVKLLKQTEHNIRFSYDTVEIRFVFDRLETAEQTQARFEKMEHLGEFLKELTNSSVPVDLDVKVQITIFPKITFYQIHHCYKYRILGLHLLL